MNNRRFMGNLHQLQKGLALVLVGKQGCGKSRLARDIATRHGSFVEIDAYELEDRFGLGILIDSQPKTLIVDGFPVDQARLLKFKKILTSDHVRCDVQYSEPKFVKSPHLIFCSNDVEGTVNLVGDSRRFFIVHMGSGA